MSHGRSGSRSSGVPGAAGQGVGAGVAGVEHLGGGAAREDGADEAVGLADGERVGDSEGGGGRCVDGAAGDDDRVVGASAVGSAADAGAAQRGPGGAEPVHGPAVDEEDAVCGGRVVCPGRGAAVDLPGEPLGDDAGRDVAPFRRGGAVRVEDEPAH